MINVLTSKKEFRVSPERVWDWQEQSSTYETEVVQRANKVYENLKAGDNIMNYSTSDVMEPSFGPKLLGMIRKTAKEYEQCLPENSDQRLTLLLSIDETAYLTKSNSKYDRPLFKDVRRTLRVFRKDFSGVFSVFVSTCSKVSNFTPPNNTDSSLRGPEVVDGRQLFPPIYKIPSFDIHAQAENVFIFDGRINTPGHYTLFGRPYWHLQSGPYDNLVNLASFKIRGGRSSSDTIENAMLAGLCILYAPKVGFRMGLASSLTASHMGILTAVSKVRERIEVIYPSGPVLVHGAHRMYQRLEGKNSAVVIQMNYLTRMIQQGIMDGGLRGELVARFLLIQSLRKAGLDNGIQKNFCTVRQVLQGMGLELTAVNGFPLLDKMIHLSHWIKVDHEISAQAIAMAFSSGAGIVCKNQQPDIDLMVPVLLDDRNDLGS
jgi:hypothetical protein